MKMASMLLILTLLIGSTLDALAKGIILHDGRGSTYYIHNRQRPIRQTNPKPTTPTNSVPSKPETLVAQPPVETVPAVNSRYPGGVRDIGLSNRLPNQIPIVVPKVSMVQNTNQPPATVRKPTATTEKAIMEVRYDDSDPILEFQKQNALKGDSRSQYALGVRYLEGIGVEKNETLAREYLQKSRDQGDSRAKEKLKQLESGRGLD